MLRRGNCHVKIIKTFAEKAEVFFVNGEIKFVLDFSSFYVYYSKEDKKLEQKLK